MTLRFCNFFILSLVRLWIGILFPFPFVAVNPNDFKVFTQLKTLKLRLLFLHIGESVLWPAINTLNFSIKWGCLWIFVFVSPAFFHVIFVAIIAYLSIWVLSELFLPDKFHNLYTWTLCTDLMEFCIYNYHTYVLALHLSPNFSQVVLYILATNGNLFSLQLCFLLYYCPVKNSNFN